jgi:four helix bundle protein
MQPSNYTSSLSRLDVYRASLELAAAINRQSDKLDGALRQQASRATPSVVLNLAEALGRRGKDRAHFLSIALGSAREVRAIVDVACATGMLDNTAAEALQVLGDRVCAMLYALRSRS